MMRFRATSEAAARAAVHSTARPTSVDLTRTVTSTPSARPRSSTDSRVMEEVIVCPPSFRATLITAMASPCWMEVTVPDNWLRVDRRMRTPEDVEGVFDADVAPVTLRRTGCPVALRRRCGDRDRCEDGTGQLVARTRATAGPRQLELRPVTETSRDGLPAVSVPSWESPLRCQTRVFTPPR